MMTSLQENIVNQLRDASEHGESLTMVDLFDEFQFCTDADDLRESVNELVENGEVDSIEFDGITYYAVTNRQSKNEGGSDMEKCYRILGFHEEDAYKSKNILSDALIVRTATEEEVEAQGGGDYYKPFPDEKNGGDVIIVKGELRDDGYNTKGPGDWTYFYATEYEEVFSILPGNFMSIAEIAQTIYAVQNVARRIGNSSGLIAFTNNFVAPLDEQSKHDVFQKLNAMEDENGNG